MRALLIKLGPVLSYLLLGNHRPRFTHAFNFLFFSFLELFVFLSESMITVSHCISIVSNFGIRTSAALHDYDNPVHFSRFDQILTIIICCIGIGSGIGIRI